MSARIWRAPLSGGRCSRKFVAQSPLPRRDCGRRTSRGLPKPSRAVRKLAAFGVGGGSTLAAMEVQNRLFRLGIAVSHASDPSLMRMIAATLGQDDVVIAISTTGAATEVIEAASIAKQYGALVVAITRPQSRLASIADIALGVYVPEAPDALKPTASRYALLAAIDLLAASTAYCKPLEAQTRMRRIKYELLKGTDGNSNGPLGD
ncbi:DNA-binding MurR/RpiR family transcriptional regulator [Bradyrhizobium niftali]|uniref:SIS domain-containing protein n=1 Tax=Bradyrhizobium niftali TaxID=2560055 RepID=UPI003835887E